MDTAPATTQDLDLSALASAARQEQIVVLKARGLTTARIAATLDISQRAVQVTLAKWRESAPTLRTEDPLDVIDEMLTGYQQDLSDLAEVAMVTTDHRARIAAISQSMAARDRIIGLLQATGVLPHDLGKLKVEIDIRYLAIRAVAVLDKWDVPEEVKRDLLAVLRGDADVVDAGELTAN